MPEVNRLSKQALAIRSHPLTVLTYLYRFLFLLIIPLMRGFLSALAGDLISWLHGAWLDILVVSLIVTLSYQKWNSFKYYMDRSGLYFTSGIFFRHETFIPMEHICTLSTLRPFWFQPLRVVKLRVDTIARNSKKADVELYIRDIDAERIMSLRRQPSLEAGGVLREYRPGVLNVIFLSLFTSNSFLGMIFISTFISQAGQLVGRELSGLLLSTFEEIARQIAFGLPPVAAGAALALFLGWLAAFTVNLLQTKNLCTRRTADTLHVEGGVLAKKEYSLRIQDLSFVDIRQSMLTRLFRLYSVYINAIGFGKDKSDVSAIVPFSAKYKAFSRLQLLLPEHMPVKRFIKPGPGAILKFILLPLWPCLLIPAAALLISRQLPNWRILIQFMGLMLSFPAYWFLTVRIMDFFSSGISRTGDYFTLYYSKSFYLHTVVFACDKIAMVHIRQSFLQRRSGKCDLFVSSRAESRTRHHIRGVDQGACIELFGLGDDGAGG